MELPGAVGPDLEGAVAAADPNGRVCDTRRVRRGDASEQPAAGISTTVRTGAGGSDENRRSSDMTTSGPTTRSTRTASVPSSTATDGTATRIVVVVPRASALGGCSSCPPDVIRTTRSTSRSREVDRLELERRGRVQPGEDRLERLRIPADESEAVTRERRGVDVGRLDATLPRRPHVRCLELESALLDGDEERGRSSRRRAHRAEPGNSVRFGR